jgi:hypothetical protein
MKPSLTDTANAAFPKNDNRQDCLFKAERELPCGSIVSERNGRIIAKTSHLPGASA